jgi:hypothetical protein
MTLFSSTVGATRMTVWGLLWVRVQVLNANPETSVRTSEQFGVVSPLMVIK